MKYAFWPGCVALGGTPELYQSTKLVLNKLGIEVEELTNATCTGAGVLQEKNKKLGDTLNVRTFAQAEQMGLPIMTVCSTCQGTMAQAQLAIIKDDGYLADINADLADEGLEYHGSTVTKHLLWILVEEYGLESLKKHFVRDLSGLKFAPFYGCYLIRPSDALGFAEVPERETSLERVIESTGAEVVDFKGARACCGLPILFINQNNSLKMVATHTGTAKDLGADAMVTPCPLCHLNLDGYQGKAAQKNRASAIDLPILHLPQMLGLAMGFTPEELGMNKHMVSTKRLRDHVEAPAAPAQA